MKYRYQCQFLKERVLQLNIPKLDLTVTREFKTEQLMYGIGIGGPDSETAREPHDFIQVDQE